MSVLHSLSDVWFQACSIAKIEGVFLLLLVLLACLPQSDMSHAHLLILTLGNDKTPQAGRHALLSFAPEEELFHTLHHQRSHEAQGWDPRSHRGVHLAHDVLCREGWLMASSFSRPTPSHDRIRQISSVSVYARELSYHRLVQRRSQTTLFEDKSSLLNFEEGPNFFTAEGKTQILGACPRCAASANIQPQYFYPYKALEFPGRIFTISAA